MRCCEGSVLMTSVKAGRGSEARARPRRLVQQHQPVLPRNHDSKQRYPDRGARQYRHRKRRLPAAGEFGRRSRPGARGAEAGASAGGGCGGQGVAERERPADGREGVPSVRGRRGTERALTDAVAPCAGSLSGRRGRLRVFRLVAHCPPQTPCKCVHTPLRGVCVAHAVTLKPQEGGCIRSERERRSIYNDA